MNETDKFDQDGYETVTEAVRALLDRFPGLADGERVAFATLPETGGLAMFPGDGAVVEKESRSVTGRVRQVCRYPFAVLFRGMGLSEEGRAAAKERLDALGRWLGRQPVTLDGQTRRLRDYPALTDGRRLLELTVLTPACLAERDEHRAETWAVKLAARYENIFDL